MCLIPKGQAVFVLQVTKLLSALINIPHHDNNFVIFVLPVSREDEKIPNITIPNITNVAAIDEQMKKGRISADLNLDIAAYTIQALSLGIKMALIGGPEKGYCKRDLETWIEKASCVISD